MALRREPPLSTRFFRQIHGFLTGWTSLKALVSRLNINCYGNHAMKKLLELRQQKTEIKTQMRNLLEKA
ncbi:hypothetical protein PJN21_29720, partial [Mycobacterium kansasii]